MCGRGLGRLVLGKSKAENLVDDEMGSTLGGFVPVDDSGVQVDHGNITGL